jgi:hypothetical protein
VSGQERVSANRRTISRLISEMLMSALASSPISFTCQFYSGSSSTKRPQPPQSRGSSWPPCSDSIAEDGDVFAYPVAEGLLFGFVFCEPLREGPVEGLEVGHAGLDTEIRPCSHVG